MRNKKKLSYALAATCLILLVSFLVFSFINIHPASLPSATSLATTSATTTIKPVQTGLGNPPGFVAILYEATIFNMSNGQTAVQTAKQFNTSFIFRGTFQWGAGNGGPESFILILLLLPIKEIS